MWALGQHATTKRTTNGTNVGMARENTKKIQLYGCYLIRVPLPTVLLIKSTINTHFVTYTKLFKVEKDLQLF